MPEEVYSSRNPRGSPLYQICDDYFEDFQRIYDEQYEEKYGYRRQMVQDVVYKFLNCGILQQGFARIRCDNCSHEYLLAFSCKTRIFCPSCNQRRALEFAEWILDEILHDVPIRTCTFTIPKMLRPYFRYHHRLYLKLSRCAYETISDLFQAATGDDKAAPGMIVAIHSGGKILNHHPHLHALLTNGCFDNKKKTFHLLPYILDEKKIEELFRHKVLKMMLEEEKITELMVEKLLNWNHSGFNIHLGKLLPVEDSEDRERTARYLMHSPVSLEKMTYLPEVGKVIYGSRNGEKNVYDALDFLALATSHIPNKGEHRIIYYGHWSKKSRGIKKKEEACKSDSSKFEPSSSSKECRLRWAHFIKKIWNKDPLICPRCSQKMQIAGFIHDPQVIRKILVHLKLWKVPCRPPPKKKDFIFEDCHYDGDTSWDFYCKDPIEDSAA
ncbi:MAG: transposase zinc-binding domain-containing protein [Firmicutes bacterium]|nr:transposase zinc-binding domain-containing protein [Bacillota bacterium]